MNDNIYCGPTWGIKKMSINLRSDEYQEFKNGVLLLLELSAPAEELHGELDSIIYQYKEYQKMLKEEEDEIPITEKWDRESGDSIVQGYFNHQQHRGGIWKTL